jgi:hypothetical protein
VLKIPVGIVPTGIYYINDDDTVPNLKKLIFNKSYLSISGDSNLKDCNYATDPERIYVARKSALNRPTSYNGEIQIIIIQSVLFPGCFQLGISPDCKYVFLRLKESNNSWIAWKSIALN